MNVALRPESLNVISLCTGGGGLDLGLELAIPCARSVVLVEREAFAVAHLVAAMQQGLMAEAPIWSDVTTFDGRPWRGIVDGLIGGIPCQPHSLAGKRLGEEDERDLWSDARRIIVQSRCWFVLIENVRGIVSSGGAERVWGDLRRLGFLVEAGLFTAAEVGASHERERWFCLAVADGDREHDYRTRNQRSGRRREPTDGSIALADAGHDGRPARSARGEFEPSASVGEQPRRDGTGLANPDSARLEGIKPGRGTRSRDEGAAAERGCGSLAHADFPIVRGQPPTRQQLQLQRDDALGLFPPGPSDLSRWRHTLERAPELEPAFRRVADGLATRLDVARVDRLRLLGNGVVSLQAAYAVRTLATRLAARGSAVAARLIRLTDGADHISEAAE